MLLFCMDSVLNVSCSWDDSSIFEILFWLNIAAVSFFYLQQNSLFSIPVWS